MAYEAERTALGAYLAKKSLKHTRQRDLILVAFLESQAHVTAEQLYEIVREINPSIGCEGRVVGRHVEGLCSGELAIVEIHDREAILDLFEVVASIGHRVLPGRFPRSPVLEFGSSDG